MYAYMRTTYRSSFIDALQRLRLFTHFSDTFFSKISSDTCVCVLLLVWLLLISIRYCIQISRSERTGVNDIHLFSWFPLLPRPSFTLSLYPVVVLITSYFLLKLNMSNNNTYWKVNRLFKVCKHTYIHRE